MGTHEFRHFGVRMTVHRTQGGGKSGSLGARSQEIWGLGVEAKRDKRSRRVRWERQVELEG